MPPLAPADLRAGTGTDNGHLGPADAFGVPVLFTYPPAHPGESPFPGEGPFPGEDPLDRPDPLAGPSPRT